MQLFNFLCAGVCASKIAEQSLPVVERVDVPTYVTQYVPVTVTETVTATLGIVATPVVHSSPASSAAPAATRLSPRAQPSTLVFPPTPRRGADFGLAHLLSSFGQWLDEPLRVTPYQLTAGLSALLSLASFSVFFSVDLHRQYTAIVISSLSKAFWAGSLLWWAFLVCGFHCLAYGLWLCDPIEFLCHRLVAYDSEQPGTLFDLFQSVPRWWASHRGDRNFWKALRATLAPVLERFGIKCLDIFQSTALVIPLAGEKSIYYGSRLVALCFWTSLWVYVVVGWVWYGIILPPVRFIGLVAFYGWKRYYPSRLLYQWNLLWMPTGDWSIDWFHREAANMTLQDRIDLMKQISSMTASLQGFNANFVTSLGKRCQHYRRSIYALTHEVNYLRRCLDIWANQDFFAKNPRLHSGLDPGPYRSGRLYFSNELSEDKFHYQVEDEQRYNIIKAYGANRGESTRFDSRLRLSGKLPIQRLFQRDPWALEAKLPGCEMPDYKLPRDASALAEKCTKGPVIKLPEDFAARGDGLAYYHTPPNRASQLKPDRIIAPYPQKPRIVFAPLHRTP